MTFDDFEKFFSQTHTFLQQKESELVRHFLIEPTTKGVKLKGCSNEPVFGTTFIAYSSARSLLFQ